jgi:hypothetical protein
VRKNIQSNVLERVTANRQRMEEQRLREEREREAIRQLNEQQKEKTK